MRAVTVCQPYAELIAAGVKLVENRTWPTKYRGRLLIHAGRSRDWMSTRVVDGVEFCAHTQKPVDLLAFGAVIATVTLLDCLPIEEIRAGKHDDRFPWLNAHEHTEGPFCWIFDKGVTRFEKPLQYRGKQGLFDINPLDLQRIAAEQALRATSHNPS